ncbi:MAG: hypothetical protein AAF984_11395 [Verrucomicrobiota bacterium]
MIIDLRDISDQGDELEGELPASDYDLPMDSFEQWKPITYRFHTQLVGNEFVVRGKLDTCCVVKCDRCLDLIDWKVENVAFYHSYKVQRDDSIDLTLDIREDILLSLPMTFACKLDEQPRCQRKSKSYLKEHDEFANLRNKEIWEALDHLEDKE